MTAQKTEREEALELAKRVIDTWGDGSPPIVQLARAFLSSAKENAEMRKIISMYVDPCDVRQEHQAAVDAIHTSLSKEPK